MFTSSIIDIKAHLNTMVSMLTFAQKAQPHTNSLLVYCLLSCFALSCFFPTYSQASTTNITLQLKWKHAFQFAGIYMAIEKGYYKDAGLHVTLIEGGTDTDPIRHVLNHENGYSIADTGALISYAKGAKIRALAAIFQHSPLALAVKKDANIASFADLRGKRIMLQTGYLNADITAALKQAGISNDQFIRQNTSFDIHDLINENTDAFSVYTTDQPHQLKALGVPYRLIHPQSKGIDFYSDIIITSDAEVRKNPKRVQAFMQATVLGWHDALAHPSQAIDLILTQYNSQNLSREHLAFEAAESAKLILPELVEIGYMHEQRWQKIEQVYASQGFITDKVSITSFLYQPSPISTIDFIKAKPWKVGSSALFLLLILAALHITLLRRTVHTKTAHLAETETNLSNIITLADIGILVHRKGQVVFANPYALKRMFTSSLQSIIGEPFTDFIHPDDRARALGRIQHIEQMATSYRHEPLRLLNPSGGVIEIDLSAVKIQFQGQPSVLVLFNDLTLANQAKAEKERILKQVEQTQHLESLGVLAGGIAHDFNNILTTILGNTELIAREPVPHSEKTKTRLNKIIYSSERAALLCQQMLAYAGQGQFSITNVNLSTALKNITSMLDVSIPSHINVEFNIDEHLPDIQADESQIQQIIMNLVLNAADAIESTAGFIHIQTGLIQATTSEFKNTIFDDQLPAGPYVYLQVTDSGCGMNEETLSKVFEPFFTTKFAGRGLGMSAVLGIVRGHKGAIEIESTVGKGTRFKLYFPVTDSAQ